MSRRDREPQPRPIDKNQAWKEVQEMVARLGPKDPAQPDAPQAEPPPPVAPPEPVADVPPVRPADATPPPVRYRVVEQRRISFLGAVTKLKVGAEISEDGYGGKPGIQKLIDQGVKLEPMS